MLHTDPQQFVQSRPQMPDDYGVPASGDGMLPWSFVSDRLRAARNYWVATISPDGRPHVRAIWGGYVAGTLCFEGSPQTRWARNLATNSAVAVHLESGDEVVIVEGTAQAFTPPDRAWAKQLSAQMIAKYGAKGYQPGPEAWDNGGLYAVQIEKVLAWTAFPQDVTRWRRRA